MRAGVHGPNYVAARKNQSQNKMKHHNDTSLYEKMQLATAPKKERNKKPLGRGRGRARVRPPRSANIASTTAWRCY